MQHTNSSTLKGLGNGNATAVPLVVPPREFWLTGFISVVCAVLVTAALWLLLLQPPKLVTFDMKGTTDRFLLQSARLKLSDEERTALLQRYNQKLNQVLTARAATQHEVIVVSAAVVAGLPDVTPQIRKDLAAAMQGGQ